MSYEVILLDRSGSLWSKWSASKIIAQALVAGIGFDPDLHLGLVSFNQEVMTESMYTRDQVALNNAINSLVPSGTTSLWDALIVALSFENPTPDVIHLISDFGENASDFSEATAMGMLTSTSTTVSELIPPDSFSAGPLIAPLVAHRVAIMPQEEPNHPNEKQIKQIIKTLRGERGTVFEPTLVEKDILKEMSTIQMRRFRT